MLTLDSILSVPPTVLCTSVDAEAVFLNTRTNQYYALEEVGARLWGLLIEGKRLRECHQMLLEEFEVDPAQLEGDMLELLTDLMENGLVEIVEA
jgi:hypothetical protein